MEQHEVDKMLGQAASKTDDQPRLKISFEKGETVKIKEGPFENFEGSVDEVLEGKGLVRVMVEIFGRPTPVELEYWQVERV
jgi:transcriptional antiterminator NusG